MRASLQRLKSIQDHLDPKEHYISIEKANKTGIIYLQNESKLNALGNRLADQLAAAIEDFELNTEIHVIIITGKGRAFCAGADVSTFIKYNTGTMFHYGLDLLVASKQITKTKKPIIAAVNGFCLGGGFELAMNCDIIIASDQAKFGQPEIKLGVIPGDGGTIRLPRLTNKYKAMEAILTGDLLTPQELGIKVVPHEKLLEEAKKIADKISSMSLPTVEFAKACVKQSQEVGVTDGIKYEEAAFSACFGLKDKNIGVTAFLNKKKPEFLSE